MRKFTPLAVALLAATVFALDGCQPAQASPTRTLTIFAASSLTDVFNDIATGFKADHPGVAVELNYASSSQLATQINEGGEADLFAPASQTSLKLVSDAGHVVGSPVVFATNRLVIITPRDNPAKIETFKDLANPGIKLVLAVKGVPIRDYADLVLAGAAKSASYGPAFSEAVHANLVSEEDNVRQVVSKVALGEADAGIVYATDLTPEMTPSLHPVTIPDDLNTTASYPMARLASSKQPELAEAWIDFVLGPRGQAILAKWGFGPPPQP